MKAHPYADLFPMMTEVELSALADDIAANGLRQPIVRYQEQILDGRNRLAACKRAGVEPAFVDYDGEDPLGVVISLNVQRRDLTAAQRAIVAARALDPFEEEARKRRGGDTRRHSGKTSPNGRARDAVAVIFKVSDKSVQQAKALLTEAPDLASLVESCASSLSLAYEQLQGRRQEVARKERDAKKVAAYKESISDGEMTVDEALKKAMEDEREERERTAAEADARGHWLKELADLLVWVERFLAQYPDEHLAWYTMPDSPGMFDHGVTPARLHAAAAQLERVSLITFGGVDGHQQTSGAQARPRAAGVVPRPR